MDSRSELVRAEGFTIAIAKVTPRSVIRAPSNFMSKFSFLLYLALAGACTKRIGERPYEVNKKGVGIQYQAWPVRQEQLLEVKPDK